MAEEPNYVAHAFKSQYNLIGLATALGFALVSGSALPLLLAGGLQLVLLPLVAGNERFQRLIRARVDDERRERSEEQKGLEVQQLLRSLPEVERQRYRGLETLAGEIRHNYRSLDASAQMLLDDLVGKLDFLLSFYLRMRGSLARYDSYFATTDAERIEERMAMLDHEIAKGAVRIREIKQRTRAVLAKRLERYHKAQENRQLIEAQTETVLEVLQLLRDQSYSMRDPREISAQLDGLVSAAEETERGVRDMDALLAADRDFLASSGLDEDEFRSVTAELPELEAAPPLAERLGSQQPEQTRPQRKRQLQ